MGVQQLQPLAISRAKAMAMAMSRGYSHEQGPWVGAMAMARIGVSAPENWWRTTKLAPESSRPKPAR